MPGRRRGGIVRTWNRKPFNRSNVDKVGRVVGAYALMTASGYVNFVNDAADLHRSLVRHLNVGDVPATQFRAWQMDSRKSARKKAQQLIREHEPYYNADAW